MDGSEAGHCFHILFWSKPKYNFWGVKNKFSPTGDSPKWVKSRRRKRKKRKKKERKRKKEKKKDVKTMASFALSAITGGAPKHVWTNILMEPKSEDFVSICHSLFQSTYTEAGFSIYKMIYFKNVPGLILSS